MNLTANNIAGLPVALASSTLSEPQLELAFAAVSACQPAGRGQRRVSRAAWWFQRMRQIVDRACDWQPAQPGRPEQTWFPNTFRIVSAAPEFNPDQRQICG